MPLSQTFPQIKTSKWVSHSTALKLRTHWVQPNSNYELIEYQWVRVHSKFCTQTTNSLSAAALKLRTHWLSVSSYALKVLHSNGGCTQTANSLSTTALKLRTHWLSVSSYALKASHSTTVALKLRTHWVQPNSNHELIDYQWVRLHSKSRTQPHSNFALKLRTHWLLVSSYVLKVLHSTTLKKWISLNLSFQSLPNS